MFPSRYFTPRYFPSRYFLGGGAITSISNFLFKNETDIYISKNPNASADATNTVRLNVKDFSYNRNVFIQEVGRETLDPVQRRTIDPYTTTVSPVNFSFTTYMLPLVDTNVTSPEEYLWVSLMGSDSLTSNPTSSTIDFSDGNVSTLPNLTLWFDRPNKTEGNYRLDNAIVDSATINFNIQGIAEIVWVGRALSVTQDSSPPASTNRTTVVNYLKNKFSTITLTMNTITYSLALIGGSIRYDNNNKFYSRVKLGEITVPNGHYTGNRTIRGNLDFYLKAGTSESAQLFNTLLSSAATNTYESIYMADISINIAGITAPFIEIDLPQVLLGIGQQRFSDAITVSIPFTVKEDSGNYSRVIYNM